MYEERVKFEENKEAFVLSFVATGIVGTIPIVMSNFILCLLLIPVFAFALGIYISNRYSGIGSATGILLVYVFHYYTVVMVRSMAFRFPNIEPVEWGNLQTYNFMLVFFSTGLSGYLGGLYKESKEEFYEKLPIVVMAWICVIMITIAVYLLFK